MTPHERARQILAIVRAAADDDAALAALVDLVEGSLPRERAEAALREHTELTTRILETVPGGVVVVSPQGAVLKANAEAVRILGLSYVVLEQRFVADFAAKTYREDGTEFPVEDYPVSRCLATGQPQPPATIGVEQPSGEIAWAVFRAVPLVDPKSQESLGAVVTFLDVSQRKTAEEERLRLEERIQQTQRLESLGALAGGIAHDFNNLLVGILGNTELALFRLGEETSALGELIGDARTAALRASELTAQLLAYSGEGPLARVPVDLRSLVDEMARLMRTTLFGRAHLTLELSDDLPGLEADPTQVRQVALNLIANAVESLGGEPGTIRIRLGVAGLEEVRDRFNMALTELRAAQYVWLEVEDDGCGMDEVTQQRLFDPFFTTKFSGRGLGLATVLSVLRRHEGAVRVVSTVGEGSRIRAYFPSTGAPQAKVQNGKPWTARRDTGLVLVVDDEQHVRLVAKRVLEEFGYEVLTAASGRTALDLYHQHADDLGVVLLDLLMDDMDGEEALVELRAAGSQVPVILCSGFGREVPDGLSGYELAGYLEKPYRLEQLVDVVGRAIRRPEV